MAKITVTVLPELYPVSGNLFQKGILKLIKSPSWRGDIILGFDKNFFPIRVGKEPPRVTFEPWVLISEDLEYLFISEDSIFSDSLDITAFIQPDGSGQFFSTNQDGEPILNVSPNINNFPQELSTANQVINIQKTSNICVFNINVPRGSKLSYSFTDVTTNNINYFTSYYSQDFGDTWIPYNGEFEVLNSSLGTILIYINISQEIQNISNTSKSFLLRLSIPDDIIYLTAEYGDNPNPAAKGDILGDFVIKTIPLPNKISGNQDPPKAYGTFKRCINDKGLAEFYGDVNLSINNGIISYEYTYYEDIYPLCIK